MFDIKKSTFSGSTFIILNTAACMPIRHYDTNQAMSYHMRFCYVMTVITSLRVASYYETKTDSAVLVCGVEIA